VAKRGQGRPKAAQKGTKMPQVEPSRGPLGAKVAPRAPLEEPRGTQDDPMATQRGAQRAKMTQDGAKGSGKVGWVRTCKSLKIY